MSSLIAAEQIKNPNFYAESLVRYVKKKHLLAIASLSALFRKKNRLELLEFYCSQPCLYHFFPAEILYPEYKNNLSIQETLLAKHILSNRLMIKLALEHGNRQLLERLAPRDSFPTDYANVLYRAADLQDDELCAHAFAYDKEKMQALYEQAKNQGAYHIPKYLWSNRYAIDRENLHFQNNIFIDLGADMLGHIQGFLPAKDFYALARTCRSIYCALTTAENVDYLAKYKIQQDVELLSYLSDHLKKLPEFNFAADYFGRRGFHQSWLKKSLKAICINTGVLAGDAAFYLLISYANTLCSEVQWQEQREQCELKKMHQPYTYSKEDPNIAWWLLMDIAFTATLMPLICLLLYTVMRSTLKAGHSLSHCAHVLDARSFSQLPRDVKKKYQQLRHDYPSLNLPSLSFYLDRQQVEPLASASQTLKAHEQEYVQAAKDSIYSKRNFLLFSATKQVKPSGPSLAKETTRLLDTKAKSYRSTSQ